MKVLEIDRKVLEIVHEYSVRTLLQFYLISFKVLLYLIIFNRTGHQAHNRQEDRRCLPDVQRRTQCCQKGAHTKDGAPTALTSEVRRPGALGPLLEETRGAIYGSKLDLFIIYLF